MYLIPKANLWVTKAVQIMIIRSAAGSSGASRGSGGEYGDYGWLTEDHLKEKAINNSKKTTATSKEGTPSTGDTPSENSKSWTNPHHESPVLEVPTCDPLYIVKEAAKHATQPKGVVNKEIVDNLRSYFDDQIIYYKTMANYNKAAMKRIKRIKRNWNKIVE